MIVRSHVWGQSPRRGYRIDDWQPLSAVTGLVGGRRPDSAAHDTADIEQVDIGCGGGITHHLLGESVDRVPAGGWYPVDDRYHSCRASGAGHSTPGGWSDLRAALRRSSWVSVWGSVQPGSDAPLILR